MKTTASLLAAFASITALNAADITKDSNITTDEVWTSDNTYILDGFVYVTDGATLTIEPGTVIKSEEGEAADASGLIIARGSKIYALGTPSDPIIFTSILDPLDGTLTEDDSGLWGGVVILGDGLMNSDKFKAGLTYPNIVDNVEGLEVSALTEFGGTDNDGAQGIFRYVSIRHGGTVLDPDNELNGLTLGAVTDNTIVEFVEVFSNEDDGIEFFGGNVNTRFMLMAFGSDDGFDWDTGWTGYGQFWAGIANSDHAGELDGLVINGENQVAELRGMGTVYNATLVGPGSDSGANEEVFEISDDAGVRYYNSIFTGMDGAAIDLIDDAQDGITELVDGTPRVDFTNNIWFDLSAGTTPEELVPNEIGRVIFSDAARLNEIEDPELHGLDFTFEGEGLDPRPSLDSPALSNALADLPDNDWFIEAGYQGAFGPYTNWAYGWTYTAEKYFPTMNGMPSSSAINISTLTQIAGDAGVVAGFVIDGDLPKAVLARAVGPQLAEDDSFFAGIAVEDPQLVLNQVIDGTPVEIGSFDDWSAGDDAAAITAIGDYVGASAITSDDKSAAAYVVLNPGVYTVTATDNAGAGGWIRLEVFDADK